MNQIRTNIDLAMRLRGLDKSKMSRKLGCSHTAVAKKLSGASPISVDEIEVWAEILNVPFRVLLSEPAEVLHYFAETEFSGDTAVTVPTTDRELSFPGQGVFDLVAA